MNKSRHVTFRCTPDQYDLIKKYSGKNVSGFILDMIFNGVSGISSQWTSEEIHILAERISKPFKINKIKDKP